MNEKGPFDVREFENRFTVDFSDNIQYMNPEVWKELNRIYTYGPSWKDRLRWFWYDLKGRWHDLLVLVRLDDDPDYDDI